MLFTANMVAVMPDHFGLSAGLLPFTTLALLPNLSDRFRVVWLVALGFLDAGTTVTNVVFPLLFLANRDVRNALPRRHTLWRLRYVLATFAVLVAGAVFLLRKPAHRFLTDPKCLVQRHWNWRLVQDPLAAADHSVAGLVYPAVGSSTLHPTIQTAVSYQPCSIRRYDLLTGPSAMAWLVLLGCAGTVVFRDRALRAVALPLFLWYVFNALFHNLWGSEYFMYTPHWSFVPLLIVLLGARRFPLKYLAPMVLLIASGQVVAISAVLRAITTVGSWSPTF